MKVTGDAEMTATTAKTFQDRAALAFLVLGCLCAVMLLILTFVSRDARVGRLSFNGTFGLIALHFTLRRDQSRLMRIGWAIMAALQVALYFANR